MERLRVWLDGVATGRVVALGWAVFFGFALVVFPLFDRWNGMPEAVTPLDLRVLYRPADVADAFAALGADGRVAYVRSLLVADIAWPAVYGSVLALTIAWGMAGRAARTRRLALALPVAAVALDLLENTTVAIHLLAYPPVLTWLAWVSSAVTTVKWVAASAATVTALAALAVRVRDRNP